VAKLKKNSTEGGLRNFFDILPSQTPPPHQIKRIFHLLLLPFQQQLRRSAPHGFKIGGDHRDVQYLFEGGIVKRNQANILPQMQVRLADFFDQFRQVGLFDHAIRGTRLNRFLAGCFDDFVGLLVIDTVVVKASGDFGGVVAVAGHDQHHLGVLLQQLIGRQQGIENVALKILKNGQVLGGKWG